MCIATRNIYGYLCKDEHNRFLYCCSNCNLEFGSGNELQVHSSAHDAVSRPDEADSPEIEHFAIDTSDENVSEAGTSGTASQKKKKSKKNHAMCRKKTFRSDSS